MCCAFAKPLLLAAILVAWMPAGCGLGGKKQPSATANFEELIAQGKLSEAEALCRNAVQSNPRDNEARAKLARALCLQGEASLRNAGFFDRPVTDSASAPKYAKAQQFFGAAVAEAQALLADEPGLANVRCTLALALYRLGQPALAIEELQRAIADDESLAEAHNTLGMIYYETGRKDEALACYQSALALRNDLPDATYNIAVLYRGEYQKHRRATDRDAAIKYYRLYLSSGQQEYSAQAKTGLAELEGPAESGARETGNRRG